MGAGGFYGEFRSRSALPICLRRRGLIACKRGAGNFGNGMRNLGGIGCGSDIDLCFWLCCVVGVLGEKSSKGRGGGDTPTRQLEERLHSTSRRVLSSHSSYQSRNPTLWPCSSTSGKTPFRFAWSSHHTSPSHGPQTIRKLRIAQPQWQR